MKNKWANIGEGNLVAFVEESEAKPQSYMTSYGETTAVEIVGDQLVEEGMVYDQESGTFFHVYPPEKTVDELRANAYASLLTYADGTYGIMHNSTVYTCDSAREQINVYNELDTYMPDTGYSEKAQALIDQLMPFREYIHSTLYPAPVGRVMSLSSQIYIKK